MRVFLNFHRGCIWDDLYTSLPSKWSICTSMMFLESGLVGDVDRFLGVLHSLKLTVRT